MRKAIVSLSIVLSVCFLDIHAQDISSTLYTDAMHKNIIVVDTARRSSSLISSMNSFERIAKAEKDKWQPYYFASYAAMSVAKRQIEPAKLDQFVDRAEEFLAKADSLSPNNSEIYCLKAILYLTRVQVDPMNRWSKFGDLGNKTLQQALKLNPVNPRANYMLGQILMATPEQFGGNRKEGCLLNDKAVALYEKEVTDTISPNWGKQSAQKLKETCQKTFPISSALDDSRKFSESRKSITN